MMITNSSRNAQIPGGPQFSWGHAVLIPSAYWTSQTSDFVCYLRSPVTLNSFKPSPAMIPCTCPANLPAGQIGWSCVCSTQIIKISSVQIPWQEKGTHISREMNKDAGKGYINTHSRVKREHVCIEATLVNLRIPLVSVERTKEVLWLILYPSNL